ncbi:hypothetical protein [Ktedonospora formicarum]|uniref:Uncharacterized protein n=1 Tax=Ktedonospora formicarum TaxID=2778364 RepID=A0A8J3MTV9_9CHLR|nr:hypothetical protein [Ktedonospora formicarum]GHO48597.1 hypothetical protein KSX_67600 [Ktedonospora formicarum]
MWNVFLWLLSHLHLLSHDHWCGLIVSSVPEQHPLTTDAMLKGLSGFKDLIDPVNPFATPTTGDPEAGKISTFFINLYDNGIKPVVYAIALFFFAWGAIGLMFPGERTQDHAKAALYRALGGLALALLATAFSSIIRNAVPQ